MTRGSKETDLVAAIADGWSWTGLRPARLCYLSDFGLALVEAEDGCIWEIAPDTLTCTLVADDLAGAQTRFQDEAFRLAWTMGALGQEARDTLGPLDDQAFAFVTPPALGGEYEIGNLRKVSIAEVFGLSGDIAGQIKDLPDGAQVKLAVVE